jgi:hypothetical protein
MVLVGVEETVRELLSPHIYVSGGNTEQPKESSGFVMQGKGTGEHV